MTLPKILAIIPARGNSTRVKNKNIKTIAGKPLIAWTIESALRSKFINEVYVSSDSKKILTISKKYYAKTIVRPKILSGSIIMPDAAIKHAYVKIGKKFDYIVMLQATSPLRASKQIDAAIKHIIKKKGDSLLSVTKSHTFLWKRNKSSFFPINYKINKRPRSQDTEFYRENGAIYITKPKILIKKNNRLGGKILIYKMNKIDSTDIDNLEDFKVTENLLKTKVKNREMF